MQIATAWLLQVQGMTAPLIGPTEVAQLKDLIDATEITLRDEEIARLETPYDLKPIMYAINRTSGGMR